MHKTSRFTFNLDPKDRRLLTQLAGEVRRSQGDTLCWLIRRAAAELLGDDPAAGAGDWSRVHPRDWEAYYDRS